MGVLKRFVAWSAQDQKSFTLLHNGDLHVDVYIRTASEQLQSTRLCMRPKLAGLVKKLANV